MDSDTFTTIRSLLRTPGITVHDLESSGLTKRQIKYRISKINAILKPMNIPTISIRQENELIIHDDTREVLRKIMKEAKSMERFSFNKEERYAYMFLLLFLNLEYVSLNDFMDRLRTSKSTTLMDLKTMSSDLSKNDITLEYNRTRGYYLGGTEMNIRRFMMRTIIYYRYASVFDTLIDDYHLDLYEYSNLVIQELAERHHIQFVEDRLFEFIYIFTFLKARISNGASAASEIENMPNIDMMHSTKEYAFTQELLENYKNTDQIKPADIKYISSWVLGISYGDLSEQTQDKAYISSLVAKIMNRFELLSGAHYSNQEEIFTQLYSHFRPAYYRLLFRLPIYNPLTDKVREEYQDLYELVFETMKPYESLFGGEIPADEIAYLTMHFAAIYAGKKATGIVQKNALVICSNGVGSSAILYNELRNMFPDMNFLPPIESRQFRDVDVPVDIIFATRYAELDDTDIPIVRVNPVMSAEEQYQTIHNVHLQLNIPEPGRPSVENVMNIIRQHADIRNEEKLTAELSAYFTQVEENPKRTVVPPESLHLEDIVRTDLIRLHESASDWEEAIRHAYQPLLEDHFITENYIEATVAALKKNRAYIVIAPHVALSHSKPEDGALSISMGIYAMDFGIDFGNPENDPVRYIFSLSATDNSSHLVCMSELLGMLNTPAFFHLLDTTHDPEEVLDFIKANRKSSSEPN